MASAPLTHPWPSPTLVAPTTRSARSERERWPATASRRALLRLALSVPYVALAAVTTVRGVTSGVNQQLEANGDLIRWGSRDFGSFIGYLYPPIPTAIARVLPGGVAALAWAGALAAGVILHVAWERLQQLDTPPWLQAVLLVCFGATPAFGFLATEDLSRFVGLGLFAVAAGAFVRFVAAGDTEAGFLCGLTLGIAVACDPVALVYAACLGAAAPAAGLRYGGTRQSAGASVLVITFPAVGALAGWTFLQWRFTGSPFGWLVDSPGVLDFPNGVWPELWSSIENTGRALLLSPLFVLTQLLVVRRRPETLLVALLPLVGLTVSLWLGLRVAGGHAVVLLGLVGLMSVPRAPSPRMAALVAVTAVASLVAITLRVALSNSVIHDWLVALTG